MGSNFAQVNGVLSVWDNATGAVIIPEKSMSCSYHLGVALKENTNIVSVSFESPTNVTSIEASALLGCTELLSVTIPAEITTK